MVSNSGPGFHKGLMKILLLTPFFPHSRADHGGGQILYQRQRHLPREVKVTLVSFIHPSERFHLQEARELFHEVHVVDRLRNEDRSAAGLFFQRLKILNLLAFTARPFLLAKFYSSSMARLVNRVASSGDFHLLQVEYSYMTQYLPHKWEKPCLFFEHEAAPFLAMDALQSARGLRRIFLRQDQARWRAHLRKICPRFTEVLAINKMDQHRLMEAVPNLQVGIWPLGIDLPSPAPDFSTPEEPRLVFFGNYTHKPNVDAAVFLASEIFPLVRAQIPAAILHLVGPHPPPEVKAFENDPGVMVPGFVEDLDGYLRGASAILAPLRKGGGLRVKNLKALALGLPLITTSLGAEGLGGSPGKDFLIAETAGEFIQAILSLLQNPGLRQSLGAGGRALVEREFFWPSRVNRMMEIYRRVLEKREDSKESFS